MVNREKQNGRPLSRGHYCPALCRKKNNRVSIVSGTRRFMTKQRLIKHTFDYKFI